VSAELSGQDELGKWTLLKSSKKEVKQIMAEMRLEKH